MTLYRTKAIKDSEELYLNDTAFYGEAVEDGNKYYPGGFEIYCFDTDDLDGDTDIEDVMTLLVTAI